MRDYYRVLNLLSLMFLVLAGVDIGFVSILGFDPLVPILGGYNSLVTRVVYAIFGISAVWVFYAYLMTPGQDYEKE